MSFSILVAAFFLSGCNTGINSVAQNTQQQQPISAATFIRSDDSGSTWEPRMRIDDKKNIAGIDVLSMAVNPFDPNNVYIGTEANGLFETLDGGETWRQVPFANKVYGLAFDPTNPNMIYGSGVLEGRAKLFRCNQKDMCMNQQLEWDEIYTEPSEGTIISSLAVDPKNPRFVYFGTSDGVILKLSDGDRGWLDLKEADGPVTGISFDAADSSHIFFAVFQRGILETKDGGQTMENITIKIDPARSTTTIYTITADPYLPGVAYVGTGSGIFKRNPDESWSELNIIESSRAYPIRVVAVNPKDSRQITYSSAKAIYRSYDSGATWSTFQLDTAKEIGVLRFDPQNADRIFAGLRKF